MDGAEVHPYADALRVYKESLRAFTAANSESFQLTLGWLRNGGETITPASVPSQVQSSQNKNQSLEPGISISRCYRSYVDIPVDKQHFSFASLGREPTLVNSTKFVPKHLPGVADDLAQQAAFISSSEYIPEQSFRDVSSIVKAEAIWSVSNLFNWEKDMPPEKHTTQACAQPYAISCSPLLLFL